MNTVVNSTLITRRARRRVLRLYGLELGDCVINPRCHFGANKITMGDGCFVNVGCTFDNTAPIIMGRDVHLGPRVVIITSRHDLTGAGGVQQRVGQIMPRPVVLEDGVGVGAGVIILSGVTVGAGTIIGAGSVVSKDCDANSIYAGSPAKKLRELEWVPRS